MRSFLLHGRRYRVMGCRVAVCSLAGAIACVILGTTVAIGWSDDEYTMAFFVAALGLGLAVPLVGLL